jgi:predicted RNA binding protein YcfA (HicA-like mRNA interferase family)
MPRKKRDIRRDLRKLGYDERQGKGDHVNYTHPLVGRVFTVDGSDEADAKPYDEKTVREARRLLDEAKRRP